KSPVEQAAFTERLAVPPMLAVPKAAEVTPQTPSMMREAQAQSSKSIEEAPESQPPLPPPESAPPTISAMLDFVEQMRELSKASSQKDDRIAQTQEPQET